MLMAGVLVVGIDAPAAPSRKSHKEVAEVDKSAENLRRIPLYLAKLDLSPDQENQIRLLLSQTDAELIRANRDRVARKAIRHKHDRLIARLLTDEQRARLPRTRLR